MARTIRTLKIGTRGSKLALAQTQVVVDRLQEKHPRLLFKIVPIRTKGDRISTVTQLRKAGKGLFTKEIESALLRRKIDVAVHSLKDMPSRQPDGLAIAAILDRKDPADAFIALDSTPLERLESGTRVAVSSLRRQAQLRQNFPNLDVVDIKGNLDTRIDALRNPRRKIGGIVVAAAGFRRLYRNDGLAVQILPKDRFVPAAGQGTICIECRENDAAVRKLVDPLHDPDSEALVKAERRIMERMEGGCQIPLGAHAEMTEEGLLRLCAYVALPDGSKSVLADARGAPEDPEGLAAALETILRTRGATEILAELAGTVRRDAPARKKSRPRAKKKKRKPARRRGHR